MDCRHPTSVRLSRLLTLAALLAAGCLWTGRAEAQNPPSAPTQDVITSPQLTDAQIASIKAFVDHFTAVFKDPKSTTEEIERAREELIKPLGGTNTLRASPDFRTNYAKLVVLGLEPIFQNGKVHTVANAMRVISSVGADRALNPLLTRVDISGGQRWQDRLRAACGCQELLQSGLLSPNKVLEAVRKLGDAAAREDNNFVLWHQLEAMNAADEARAAGPNALNAADRAKIRALLVEAIGHAIERHVGLKDPKNAEPPVAAVNNAVSHLRDKFADVQVMDTNEQAAIGKAVAPALGKMLQIALDNWDAGHQDTAAKALYSTMVLTCEGFLVTIDSLPTGSHKAPDAKLKAAWDSGDKARFQEALKAWSEILSKPPYTTGQ